MAARTVTEYERSNVLAEGYSRLAGRPAERLLLGTRSAASPGTNARTTWLSRHNRDLGKNLLNRSRPQRPLEPISGRLRTAGLARLNTLYYILNFAESSLSAAN